MSDADAYVRELRRALPRRAAGPQLVIEPQTGYARPVLLTLQAAVQRHHTAQAVTPIAIRLTHVP